MFHEGGRDGKSAKTSATRTVYIVQLITCIISVPILFVHPKEVIKHEKMTEVQTLGVVPCPHTLRIDVRTCMILSERGIYGSLLRKRRRLEYLVAYLCFR